MSWNRDSAQQAPSPAKDPDTSKSRFHGRGEEMVKGAAMEAVLLLRQCPLGIAENFAVAVRDMSAALLEKQHELLARANAAPLELPPALPQPNARDFPTSQKRKMTGHEGALQDEIDVAVRRRREAINAQAEYNDRCYYTDQAVKATVERHSQRQEPPSAQPSSPPSPSPASPIPRSLLVSSSPSLSSSSDSESPHESRPRRGVRRTQKLVDNSQTAREVAAAKGRKGKDKEPMRRKPGKKALAAAAEMSQLLDGYVPPPSSAVLLNK
jgi:hypothetical protein